MKRNGWKWALLGGAFVFIVLYGIEMSTAGIERIHGPMNEGAAPLASPIAGQDDVLPLTYSSETERKIIALEKELAEIRMLAARDELSRLSNEVNPRLLGMPYDDGEPPVNKLADSTSSLLQSVSSNSIRFVASLFEGFIK